MTDHDDASVVGRGSSELLPPSGNPFERKSRLPAEESSESYNLAAGAGIETDGETDAAAPRDLSPDELAEMYDDPTASNEDAPALSVPIIPPYDDEDAGIALPTPYDNVEDAPRDLTPDEVAELFGEATPLAEVIADNPAAPAYADDAPAPGDGLPVSPEMMLGDAPAVVDDPTAGFVAPPPGSAHELTPDDIARLFPEDVPDVGITGDTPPYSIADEPPYADPDVPTPPSERSTLTPEELAALYPASIDERNGALPKGDDEEAITYEHGAMAGDAPVDDTGYSEASFASLSGLPPYDASAPTAHDDEPALTETEAAWAATDNFADLPEVSVENGSVPQLPPYDEPASVDGADDLEDDGMDLPPIGGFDPMVDEPREVTGEVIDADEGFGSKASMGLIAADDEPQLPENASEDQRILYMLVTNDSIKTLWARIDQLEMNLIEQMSPNVPRRAVSLNQLQKARELLLSGRDKYDDARRLVAEVDNDLNYIPKVRLWSRRYGWWLLLYSVGWWALFLVGAVLVTSWIDRAGIALGSFATVDIQRLWLTTMFGGGGGVLAAIWSLKRHIADLQDFDSQHLMWYITTPLNGAMLGVLLYLASRAGLLISGEDPVIEYLLYAVALAVGFRQNVIYDIIRRLLAVLQTSDDSATTGTTTTPTGTDV